jgi:hypothetical protein
MPRLLRVVVRVRGGDDPRRGLADDPCGRLEVGEPRGALLVARGDHADHDRAVELAREAAAQAGALHIDPAIIPDALKPLVERSVPSS